MMPDVIVIKPNQNSLSIKQKVAAYARVSSNSDEQLHSYKTQIRYYTDLISEMKNSEFAGIYADEGISGTKADKRPNFLKMIEDCKRRKINRIITKSVSRFARNAEESLEYAHQLKAINGSVYFEEDDIDTATMDSDAIFILKSAAAQAGSESISQNLKLGLRMKMKSGTFISASVPYGYDYIDQKLVINPEQAKIVKRIFEEYLGGYGTETIALHLNKDKIPCKDKGKEWHHSHIQIILDNPKYYGCYVMQRSFHSDVLPFKKHINQGELPQYIQPNNHEGIISRKTFDDVQATMKFKSDTFYKPPTFAEQHVFAKTVRCGKCGHKYKKSISHEKTYWRCSYHSLGNYYCDAPPISEEELKRLFCKMYNKLKANINSIVTPAITQLRVLYTKNRSSHEEMMDLEKEIANVRESILLIAKLRKKSLMDDEDYLEQKAEYENQLSNLKKERAFLINENANTDVLKALEKLVRIIEQGPEYMKEFDCVIYEEIIKCVIANEDKISFQLKCGITFNESRKES